MRLLLLSLLFLSLQISAQALDLVDKDGNVVANSTTSIEEINALADGVYKFEQPQKTITIDKPSIEVVNKDGVVVADGSATLGELILLPDDIYTIKTYIPITISSVVVENNEVTVSWIPPTENTDGSSLDDLAGFTVYYGDAEHQLINSITVNSPLNNFVVIEGLTNEQTYYFAVVAFNEPGIESELSNIVSKKI